MYGRRGALEHRQWAEAFSYLSAAQRDEQLEAEVLERLGVAAYMVGSDRLRSQVEPVDSVPSWAQFRRVTAALSTGSISPARSAVPGTLSAECGVGVSDGDQGAC